VRERRAPVIAGVAVVVVLLLAAFFLLLPKLGQVRDANAALDQARAQESTLGSQLAALKQAQTEAPTNRETIRKVEQAIPPTVDQQGFILLVRNAALQSSIDVVTLTPSTPVFDPATGLSTITNSVSVTGSYFAITQFLFSVETLPRAAKVTAVTITPSPSETDPSLLTLDASIDVFTSDTSAGPGSSPGPTTGAAGSDATTAATGASPAAVSTTGA